MSLPHTFRYLLTCLIRKVGSKINKSFGTERKNTLRSAWQRTWGREREWNFCRSLSERVGAEEKEGEEESKGWNICLRTLRLRWALARTHAQAQDWILLQAVLHLEKGRGGRIFNKLIVMRIKYLGLFFIHNFIYLVVWAFLWLWRLGRLWSWGMWASHCGGFSFCGAQALGHAGCSSWGTWALHRLSRCGLVAPRHMGSSWIRDETRLLHWQADSLSLSHQGSPCLDLFFMTTIFHGSVIS